MAFCKALGDLALSTCEKWNRRCSPDSGLVNSLLHRRLRVGATSLCSAPLGDSELQCLSSVCVAKRGGISALHSLGPGEFSTLNSAIDFTTQGLSDSDRCSIPMLRLHRLCGRGVRPRRRWRNRTTRQSSMEGPSCPDPTRGSALFRRYMRVWGAVARRAAHRYLYPLSSCCP